MQAQRRYSTSSGPASIGNVEDRADRAVAEAKAALGEEAFAAAWARGQAMTVDDLVAFAGAR